MPPPSRPAFTLIKLLVVIAIIGILASLVVVQLGTSRTKARNAQAQSDITEMSKAVEAFRNDETASEKIISNLTTSSSATVPDTLTVTTGTLSSLFTGTQSTSGPLFSYAADVTHTPNSSYTYSYVATGTSGSTATPTSRVLVGPSGQTTYALCTTLVNMPQPYACTIDAASLSQSPSDQTVGVQNLGGLPPATLNGLVVWYKLDGNTNNSTGTDTGTLIGNPAFSLGKFGSSLALDGSTQYMTAPYVDVSLAFTVSAWINEASAPTNNGIYSIVYEGFVNCNGFNFYVQVHYVMYSGPICQDSKTASFKVDYVSSLSFVFSRSGSA